MTEVLLEVNVVELVTSVPFSVALKVMVVLVPIAAKLIGEDGLEVRVRLCCVCPTVTVVDPCIAPLVPVLVAVIVTPVLPVAAIPLTRPVELTVT